MGIPGTLDASELYGQATRIVMSENACGLGAAQSSLAGMATMHRLTLAEVAAAVIAVAGSALTIV